MSDYFEVDQEVLDIAQAIIQQYKPKLAAAKIIFVFREEAPRKNGQITLGQASKVAPKFRPHLDADFLIWLAFDRWQDLTDKQRRALVHHELCHCDYDEVEETARMKPHDVEEFAEIVAIYGFWNSSLHMMVPAVEQALQLPMPGLRDKPEGQVGTFTPKNIRVMSLVSEAAE